MFLLFRPPIVLCRHEGETSEYTQTQTQGQIKFRIKRTKAQGRLKLDQQSEIQASIRPATKKWSYLSWVWTRYRRQGFLYQGARKNISITALPLKMSRFVAIIDYHNAKLRQQSYSPGTISIPAQTKQSRYSMFLRLVALIVILRKKR